MKSIELTEEHKSKLLEMCKVLFPKYTFIEWNLLGKSAYDKGYLKYYTDKMKYAKFIHWFEFCVKYLIPKLFSEEIDGFTDNTYREWAYMNLEYNNPIDYLYLEFKKLK